MPAFLIPIHEHGDPDRPGPYPHGSKGEAGATKPDYGVRHFPGKLGGGYHSTRAGGEKGIREKIKAGWKLRSFVDAQVISGSPDNSPAHNDPANHHGWTLIPPPGLGAPQITVKRDVAARLLAKLVPHLVHDPKDPGDPRRWARDWTLREGLREHGDPGRPGPYPHGKEAGFRGNAPSHGRKDVEPQFDFASQVGQYPATGPPGIGYFRGDVDPGPAGREQYVDTLLFRDQDGKVRGILNHYPMDIALRMGGRGVYGGMWVVVEHAGNVNVMVDPTTRRQGVATKLLQQAGERWAIDLSKQTYTAEGRKFTRAIQRKLVKKQAA